MRPILPLTLTGRIFSISSFVISIPDRQYFILSFCIKLLKYLFCFYLTFSE